MRVLLLLPIIVLLLQMYPLLLVQIYIHHLYLYLGLFWVPRMPPPGRSLHLHVPLGRFLHLHVPLGRFLHLSLMPLGLHLFLPPPPVRFPLGAYAAREHE